MAAGSSGNRPLPIIQDHYKGDNGMSKETAKKLIADLQTNDELKAKIRGQLVKAAAGAGYDVTTEEMAEAEKQFISERTKKTKLSSDELDAVAGGVMWHGEKAPDGHEFDCDCSYHDYSYQAENNF